MSSPQHAAPAPPASSTMQRGRPRPAGAVAAAHRRRDDRRAHVVGLGACCRFGSARRGRRRRAAVRQPRRCHHRPARITPPPPPGPVSSPDRTRATPRRRCSDPAPAPFAVAPPPPRPVPPSPRRSSSAAPVAPPPPPAPAPQPRNLPPRRSIPRAAAGRLPAPVEASRQTGLVMLRHLHRRGGACAMPIVRTCRPSAPRRRGHGRGAEIALQTAGENGQAMSGYAQVPV